MFWGVYAELPMKKQRDQVVSGEQKASPPYKPEATEHSNRASARDCSIRLSGTA